MKKSYIIIIAIIVLILIGIGIYFFLGTSTQSAINNTATLPVVSSSTTGNLLPIPTYSTSTAVNPVLPTSSLSDYIGTASEIFGATPTGTILNIGTSNGIVTVNNFYLNNPPVDSDEDLVIKFTQNYVIDYDPTDSSFWIGVSGIPFAVWQPVAEQNLLQTLGVSESDACKLHIVEGVIYSANNPDNGQSFSFSICGASAAN